MQNIPELLSAVQKMHFTIFFHPDYTVGFGVSPNHTLRLAGFTAGRDLHPALKIVFVQKAYPVLQRPLYSLFTGIEPHKSAV